MIGIPSCVDMNSYMFSTCWDNSQLLLSTLVFQGLDEDFFDTLLTGGLDSDSNGEMNSCLSDTSPVLIHDPFMGFQSNAAEDVDEDIVWV